LDPLSDFLKEEANTPNVQHLAADPYRVLRVATEYMELGLYQKALNVLERSYPSVPADYSESGSVLPQKHPLVLYYAGYCQLKLGKDPTAEWQSASQLSSNLIFPSTNEDRIVLESVVATNSQDATALYLLGTQIFSRGLYDSGIERWMQAKQRAPELPVVDANLGKAWLLLKHDPQRALASFQKGLKNDPTNAEVYVGIDEAMSLTGASAEERAAMLGRYPSSDNTLQGAMPSYLVYQLALTRAEGGQFDPALALFKNRFFQSEEGGIRSEQVLFEIKLMQAESEAKLGRCKLAEDLLHDGQDGLDLNGALAQGYLRLGKLAESCHQPEFREWMSRAASGTGTSDAVWADTAQRSIGPYAAEQQQNKLQAALVEASRLAQENGHAAGWWWYNVGLLEVALNQKEQSREALRKALLMQDSFMSHHLSRMALNALSK
jgi:tetratricopeptide (TPR) repeat protein